MDGKLHRRHKRSKNRGDYYYFFAREFGWSKKEVDEQPIDYLADLIKSHMKQMEKENKIQTKPPPLPRKYRKL